MTGTIMKAAGQVTTDLTHDALQHSFVNKAGEALTEGVEVVLQSDGTVTKRTAPSERPFGIVIKGGEDGQRVTIRTYFTALINAIAFKSELVPGDYVRPDGSKDGIYPKYSTAVSGNYVVAQVIVGGLDGQPVRIGIFQSPVYVI